MRKRINEKENQREEERKKKENFFDAVRNDDSMPEDMRNRWLALEPKDEK